jgi:hypothetical protein
MQFRKKPVVIDAYQVDQAVEIVTLEGVMRAAPGDWMTSPRSAIRFSARFPTPTSGPPSRRT